MKKGFTLIEMLVVIAIIAILSGVMFLQFSGSSESARAAKCMTNMRNLAVAVQSFGADEGYYPPAGTIERDFTQSGERKYQLYFGWISGLEENVKKGADTSVYSDYSTSSRLKSEISAYTEDDKKAIFAMTNGCLWTYTGRSASSYMCPNHLTKMQKAGLRLRWSYAMNGYFGYSDSSTTKGAYREYGSLMAADRTLLFAEIPFVSNGFHSDPSFSTSDGDQAVDCILQPDSDTSTIKASSPETIGFNHEQNHRMYAHVVFADGHVQKLLAPSDESENSAKELTKWLANGTEYSFDGAKYEKVDN